ncbi:hypothetical protein [Pseudofrankia inefficax]|uniref:hypothetical protein n=1 Tax=Pseudofrankia inefficax (strain DSM 45817 / CECT 9037 / DDB 130130 / EuI1c) TaxID=298654 RepID=UPI0001BFACFF|nr:hypothetical protein [Pseudofrankia inefficax]
MPALPNEYDRAIREPGGAWLMSRVRIDREKARGRLDRMIVRSRRKITEEPDFPGQ